MTLHIIRPQVFKLLRSGVRESEHLSRERPGRSGDARQRLMAIVLATPPSGLYTIYKHSTRCFVA